MIAKVFDCQWIDWGFMAIKVATKSEASLTAQPGPGGGLLLEFSGRLDSANVGDLWHKAIKTVDRASPGLLTIEAGAVDYCDGCGLGLLFELQLRGQRLGYNVEIKGLAAEFQRLLDMFDVEAFREGQIAKSRRIHVAEEIGHATAGFCRDIGDQTAYVGELCAALIGTLIRPWRLRWKDFFWIAEQAGANAAPIAALLGFLFGLIMAYSSAMPLRQFGVEVYVADLAAIALVRVIGPFITAIVLAGRTGSAFAAELGTMKINEELDAMTTMRLDPIHFLVVPRVLATTIVTPLLAVITNIAGIVGAGVVLLSLGFPLVTYTQHVESAIDTGDVLAGLFKAVVYGTLVGAVGCLRGLQTSNGASAVGISTTRAVVTGIVLVVVAEGIFAVLYHYLGI